MNERTGTFIRYYWVPKNVSFSYYTHKFYTEKYLYAMNIIDFIESTKMHFVSLLNFPMWYGPQFAWFLVCILKKIRESVPHRAPLGSALEG